MHPTYTASRTSIRVRGTAVPGAEDRQGSIPGFNRKLCRPLTFSVLAQTV